MVEVQLFFENLFSLAGHLAGDFVTSITGFISAVGGGIRDVLVGLNISR